MWDLAAFGLGLCGLWVGTELVIPATMALGKRRGLSEAVLGFTVLAIGTDLPELLVAVSGGLLQLQGVEASGVIMGNAVGSAIAQGTLVLAVAALAHGGSLSARITTWDGFALGAAILLLFLLGHNGRIDRMDGAFLLLCYCGYFATLFRRVDSRTGGVPRWRADDTRVALRVVGGILLVVFSADVVVERAVDLATRWGIAQSAVGVLIIGASTSLPELALSFGAAARGRPTLSVANVLGSNAFDLLVPVGASAVIHPVGVERTTLFLDLPVVGLATLLVFARLRRRGALSRVDSALLIVLYVAYAITRIAIAA